MLLQEQDDMNTKKLTRCALFASMALIIHVLESMLPPLAPIPGIKVGIANVITLAAVYIIGSKEALWILIVRIILGNFFSGQIMSLIYSLCGGLLCYAVTISLKRFFIGDTVWFLGVIGAIVHNIGQIVCACILFGSWAFAYYGAVLCAFSCVSGSFTGLCAQYMIKYFDKNNGQ